MKNVILGFIGCLITVCTILSCIDIYSISVRRNELENCIGQVLKQSMKEYYGTEISDEEAAACVRQELEARLNSASQISINIRACSMEFGILSVEVKEIFVLPGGKKKFVKYEKTIIVE